VPTQHPHRAAQLASRLPRVGSSRPVGRVDGDDVGDLEDPALDALQLVARAGQVRTGSSRPGVFVALDDLTGADEQTLDACEGADSGLYRRVHLRVQTLTGDEVAYVYVLDAFEGGLPSARHLGGIADAAEAAGAPTDYVTALRSRECRSTGV
jgi:hypothetical protein